MNTHASMRDSVDLLVSAVIVAGLHGDREQTNASSRAVVAHADDMGRVLLTAMAVADRAPGQPLPPDTTDYEWRPVLEFMGEALERSHLLQIERTRRHVVDVTDGLDGWLGAQTVRLLAALEGAVRHGLQGAPRAAGDYAGIGSLDPIWTRSAPSTSAVTPRPHL